jgi:putative membrane-bound dehydrogenase-like protein
LAALAFFIIGGCLVRGSETTTNFPIPVSEAANRITLPTGFKPQLFAGEPAVHQPIAMAFDDRGRLWVAECYTYSDAKTNFDLNLHDRILIFEDSKGTGHFDKSKVFWDQGQRLTSIALGFGGVFATCAPNLIFIPDRDGDDVPDGPPEVLLDGWNSDAIRHNIVNGLKWGPDGWLYGRHGIMANSSVGKPGADASARTNLNGAIWRYHPTRKVFEVVCHGTTNPWGHDWDQYGELFFVNTVIGHLWHGIPGAYYRRMYGEHLAPYRYALMEQAADHYHWDTGKTWQDSRNAAAGAGALGGGHAHSGLMIYLGDNWPEQYQGKLFMLNFHGRRINEDLPERKGSGVVAKHGPDFMNFADSWFRGIELDYGPDGGVYILDWSDTGECHENDADGVHRENGRIYKVTYDGGGILFTNNLATQSDSDLIRLQLHPNEWYARHARRVLQERARAPGDTKKLTAEILGLYNVQPDVPRKLRLMFALHAVGADSEPWLKSQIVASDDHIRSWAVRFLAESETEWPSLIDLFTQLAATDPSPTVRLYLASSLQRAPTGLRMPLAAALLEHDEDVADQNLPLMLWYAIEPIAAQYPKDAVDLARHSRIPLVREFVSRRLAEEMSSKPESVENLLEATLTLNSAAQLDILRGLAAALRGWRKAPKPIAWEGARKFVTNSSEPEAVKLTRELGIIFGDAWALDDLRKLAQDTQTDPAERLIALRQLIEARPDNLQQTLRPLLNDSNLAGAAARGLMLFESPELAKDVMEKWDRFAAEDRAAIIGLMASRPSSAGQLLDAMAEDHVPKSALSAFEARQIRNFNNDKLTRKLTAVWGEVRTSAVDKIQLMARYRKLFTTEQLKKADPSRGREVFNQTCAVCHKLYGEGAAIGPDLTGGGRGNLDYLLENIVDPSAIVPADYRVADVELKDDRSLTALIVAKTERTLTLQTPTERLIVDRSEVVKIRETSTSLMPEGLLQGLNDDQICNLFGYLMAPNQAPLPPHSASK